ncbi:syntaxin 16 [Pseudohyphozyma bogoriensis]|nr:syntaxin 16 [Pseudohyphozyma bogoriensis]
MSISHPSPPYPEPYTRSRTNLFLSYRDSAIRPSSSFYSRPGANEDDESRVGLMHDLDAPGGSAGSSRSLPPKWVDISDRVDEVIERVKPKLDKLDKLHAKHLLPGFKDRSAEEREIEALSNDITRDFRTTQSHIRRIAELSSTLLSNPASSSSTSAEARRLDLIMAANVQTALATKVQDLSGVFRKKQSEYLRRLKAGTSGSGTPTGSSFARSGGQEDMDPLMSLADDEQYVRSYLLFLSQQTLSHLPPTSSFAIDQRTNEITSLAQSITDLADLFKDLQSLVIDQGTLLDRVDWNVEQMVGEVKGAVTELERATSHQKSSGKCQLIFLLLLLIAGCLIFIFIRPSRHPSPTPIADPIPGVQPVELMGEAKTEEMLDLADGIVGVRSPVKTN